MGLSEVSSKHTKLNKIEILKSKREWKQAWEALKRYSQEGYDSIAKEDIDYFLKCFGVFDRPATPKKFMIRVRISGGRLSSQQAETLGNLAKEYGQDYIDLTTRMQVQLRYVDIKDVPTILEELEKVGITTWQTGVDNFRNIVCDPLDGISFDSIIETSDIIKDIESIWLKKAEWIAALPRKFNTSISGSLTNRCNLFAHDCCFALAIKEGEYGFNVYLGGKVGAVAKSADIFLPKEDVTLFYESLITTYKDFGFRDNRNKNRLHFLIKEAGMQEVVNEIKKRASKDFLTAGKTLVKEPRREEVDGRIRLKDGTFAVHMVVPSGIFSGTAMVEAAKIASDFGNGYLNISTTQNIFILGVEQKDIQTLLSLKPFDKYSSVSTPYFNQMVACAGLDVCPYGVIPNKPDAIEMAEFLSKEVPLPKDSSIKMHWSACIKGCGVHELGDIGFLGCKVKIDKKVSFGVHILLGGKSSTKQEEAYTILKSIPLENAKYYVAFLAKTYLKLKKPNESFEDFETRVFRRYSKGAIEFILRWNVEIAEIYKLSGIEFKPNWQKNIEQNEIFELGVELYKELCGKKPYQGIHNYNPIETTPAADIRDLNSSVPKRVSDVIMKMIAPFDKRYEVFSEVLVDILKD